MANLFDFTLFEEVEKDIFFEFLVVCQDSFEAIR